MVFSLSRSNKAKCVLVLHLIWISIIVFLLRPKFLLLPFPQNFLAFLSRDWTCRTNIGIFPSSVIAFCQVNLINLVDSNDNDSEVFPCGLMMEIKDLLSHFQGLRFWLFYLWRARGWVREAAKLSVHVIDPITKMVKFHTFPSSQDPNFQNEL